MNNERIGYLLSVLQATELSKSTYYSFNTQQHCLFKSPGPTQLLKGTALSKISMPTCSWLQSSHGDVFHLIPDMVTCHRLQINPSDKLQQTLINGSNSFWLEAKEIQSMSKTHASVPLLSIYCIQGFADAVHLCTQKNIEKRNQHAGLVTYCSGIHPNPSRMLRKFWER